MFKRISVNAITNNIYLNASDCTQLFYYCWRLARNTRYIHVEITCYVCVRVYTRVLYTSSSTRGLPQRELVDEDRSVGPVSHFQVGSRPCRLCKLGPLEEEHQTARILQRGNLNLWRRARDTSPWCPMYAPANSIYYIVDSRRDRVPSTMVEAAGAAHLRTRDSWFLFPVLSWNIFPSGIAIRTREYLRGRPRET